MADQDSAKRARQAARFIGAVCFLATLPIYSPNIMVASSFDAGGYTGYYAEPLLVISLVASLFFLARSIIHKQIGAESEASMSPRMSLVVDAVYLLGLLGFFVFEATSSALTEPAAAVIGFMLALCCGATILPQAISWVRAFGGLDMADALAAVAGAMLLVGLIESALVRLAGFLTMALLVLLALAGVALRRAVSGSRGAGGDNAAVGQGEVPHFEAATPASAEPGGPSTKATLLAFGSVMGMALIGMAISSFVVGVLPTSLFDRTVDVQRLGAVAGGAVLLVVALLAKGQSVYPLVFQAVLPCAAALVLVLLALPTAQTVTDISLACSFIFFSMVSIVAIATALAVSNAHEFSRAFVFSTIIAAFTGVAILGIALGAAIPGLQSAHTALVATLTCLYAALSLLIGNLRSWRLTVGRSDSEDSGGSDGKPSSEDEIPVEQRLGKLAASAALTPREIEILGYVGRGHSSVYVAKTLLISESTVYTHVRNIYRKLGVSSREELIQLIARTR